MEVEDRQRHRQALAALDHPREVGILQIVVGLAVAAIGVGLGDDLGQRFGRGAAPAHQVGHGGGHRRHVLAERREDRARSPSLQHAQRQRRFEKVETLAVAGAEIAQAVRFFWVSNVDARHRLLRGAPDIGQVARPQAQLPPAPHRSAPRRRHSADGGRGTGWRRATRGRTGGCPAHRPPSARSPRALTSTKTSRPPRRATMSISPSLVL